MKNDIEQLLRWMSDIQGAFSGDKLSELLNEYNREELSEENLDLVYAAQKNNTSFDAFLKLAKKKEMLNLKQGEMYREKMQRSTVSRRTEVYLYRALVER